MSRTSLVLLLPVIVLLLAVASCGGTAQLGTDGVGSGVQSGTEFQGVQEGDFRLVRFNEEGTRDDALNSTLDLQVEQGPDTTTVRIAVDDSAPASGVILDLIYDPDQYSPADVEFSDLITTPIEGAFTTKSGVVGLGQASVDGPVSVRGDFATITFRNEPHRRVSDAGDPHQVAPDVVYSANGATVEGMQLSTTDLTTGDLDYSIFGLFARGDGDQNGETNAADLVPIAAKFLDTVSVADFSGARADYDQNGEINAADIVPVAGNFLEKTDTIEVLVADSDTMTDADVFTTFGWQADGVGPTFTTPSTDPRDMWRHWDGTLTAAEAGAIDAAGDGDGFVWFAARSANASGKGPLSTPVQLTVGLTPNPNFTSITDAVFQVVGATGGSGPDSDIFQDGDTIEVVANSDVTLQVIGFSGTYDDGSGPIVFTNDNLNGVPQGEYDAELERINQSLDNAAYSQFLNVPSIVDEPFAINANAGTGFTDPARVAPDDETGNNAEGVLEIQYIDTAITFPIMTVDLTQDDEAALITSLTTGLGQDGNGDWQIGTGGGGINGEFNFPSNAPTTVDGDSIDLELWNLDSNTMVRRFEYSLPAAQGQFQVTDLGGGNFRFDANVGPGQVSGGSLYMVRITRKDTTDPHPSSVNKPGQYIVFGGPPPHPAQNLLTLPFNGIYEIGENEVSIIFPDPVIRRTPEVLINPISGAVTPVHDADDDFLKQTGLEFQPAGVNGNSYPRAIVIEGSDPTGIAHDTATIPGVLQTATDYDRIVLDIAVLQPAADTTYAFKVFGFPLNISDPSSAPEIGSGTFTRVVDPGIQEPLTVVDFGVNVFGDGLNRGELELNAADWSNKQLDLPTLPDTRSSAGSPDVLFVQFSGGVVDSVDNWGQGNNWVVFEDQGGVLGTMERATDVRVAGLSGGVNYIGIVHLTRNDTVAIGGGNLAAGLYNLSMRSPTSATPVAFADPLIVTGAIIP